MPAVLLCVSICSAYSALTCATPEHNSVRSLGCRGSKIEKKAYYPIFKVAGFTSFDGQW